MRGVLVSELHGELRGGQRFGVGYAARAHHDAPCCFAIAESQWLCHRRAF